MNNWNDPIHPHFREYPRVINAHIHRSIGFNLYRSQVEIDLGKLKNILTMNILPSLYQADVDIKKVTAQLNKPASYVYMYSRCHRTDTVGEVLEKIRQDMRNDSPNELALRCVYLYNHRQVMDEVLTHLNTWDSVELLDYGTLLTTTPYHKVALYKRKESDEYYLISSDYTSKVLEHFAAAVMHHKNQLHPEINALVTTVFDSTPDKYIDMMTSFFSPYLSYMRRVQKFEVLLNVDKTFDTIFIDQAQALIRRCRGTIQDYEQRLQHAYKDLDRVNMRLLSASAVENPFKEFTEYLMQYCEEEIVSALLTSSSDLVLNITKPLLYWDDKEYMMLKDSKRTNCYNDAPKYIQELLDDIFIHKTVTLIFEQAFALSLNALGTGDSRDMIRAYQTNDKTLGIPNPHLNAFNCWGNNLSIICNLLQEQKFIEAYTTIGSVIAALNIMDITVFSSFVQQLKNWYNGELSVPCLKVKATGKRTTISKYIKSKGEQA